MGIFGRDSNSAATNGTYSAAVLTDCFSKGKDGIYY
jgi:hypothetical protein